MQNNQTPEEKQSDQTCHAILKLYFWDNIELANKNPSLFQQDISKRLMIFKNLSAQKTD